MKEKKKCHSINWASYWFAIHCKIAVEKVAIFLGFWSIFLYYFPFRLPFPFYIIIWTKYTIRSIFNMNGAPMGGFPTKFQPASNIYLLMIRHNNKARIYKFGILFFFSAPWCRALHSFSTYIYLLMLSFCTR